MELNRLIRRAFRRTAEHRYSQFDRRKLRIIQKSESIKHLSQNNKSLLSKRERPVNTKCIEPARSNYEESIARKENPEIHLKVTRSYRLLRPRKCSATTPFPLSVSLIYGPLAIFLSCRQIKTHRIKRKNKREEGRDGAARGEGN